jgi:hypothetical protein
MDVKLTTDCSGDTPVLIKSFQWFDVQDFRALTVFLLPGSCQEPGGELVCDTTTCLTSCTKDSSLYGKYG